MSCFGIRLVRQNKQLLRGAKTTVNNHEAVETRAISIPDEAAGNESVILRGGWTAVVHQRAVAGKRQCNGLHGETPIPREL